MTTSPTTTVRDTEAYETMTSYIACSIIEGFSDEEPTEEDHLAAWQYLVDTGIVSSLQGFYGRTAAALIEGGVIEAAA